MNRDLARLIFSVESADMRPADTVKAALEQNCDALEKDLAQWQQLNQQDVPAFNQLLSGGKGAADRDREHGGLQVARLNGHVGREGSSA